jgi:hypothetical protein
VKIGGFGRAECTSGKPSKNASTGFLLPWSELDALGIPDLFPVCLFFVALPLSLRVSPFFSVFFDQKNYKKLGLYVFSVD